MAVGARNCRGSINVRTRAQDGIIQHASLCAFGLQRYLGLSVGKLQAKCGERDYLDWAQRDLLKDIGISLLYTLLIVVLIKFKIIHQSPITCVPVPNDEVRMSNDE